MTVLRLLFLCLCATAAKTTERLQKCGDGMGGDGTASDKPRIISTSYACFCNEIAGEMYPEKCDAICPPDGLIEGRDCICVDPKRGGKNCDQEVCRLGGKAYCKGHDTTETSEPSWELCEMGVNPNRTDEITQCNCTLKGETDYNGVTCEDFAFRGMRRPSVSSSSKSTLSPSMKIVVIVLGTVVGLTIIGFYFYRNYRKKGHASGAVVYTPSAPGYDPSMPSQTQPGMYVSTPAPGQAAVGYDQASGLTTTYSFQPIGGGPPASAPGYAPSPAQVGKASYGGVAG